MSDPYPVRPITPDEFDAYELVNQHAFQYAPTSSQGRSGQMSLIEWNRTLAAFDPELSRPVGVTAVFSFQLTVPGASLPAAGVSWVAVLPTHRRRGVLTSLMRRQLADIGEPLAILWASEAGIYGRYGYGRASWTLTYDIRRGEGALIDVPPGPRVRLVPVPDARPELAKVHDLVLQSRPGFYARNTHWWDKALYDPPERRNGASPLRCLLAEDARGTRGYALYSAVHRGEGATFLPDNALNVRELIAVDAAASAALWQDLLSRDLVSSYRAPLRPVDDPLLFQLADPRRARPVLTDALWVRIMDLPAALTGRRYACPVDVVIEVTDRQRPGNAGRWRLSAGAAVPGGAGFAASCERTTDPADLSLDIAELGAAYLGGTRLSAPAGADLVTEHRPGAVRQLSAAMSWDPAPWCPLIF